MSHWGQERWIFTCPRWLAIVLFILKIYHHNEYACLPRDEKSRTFSSNSQTSYILLNLVAKQSLDFVLHRLSGVLVEVDTDNIGRAVYLLSDGGCGVLCGGLCCCVSVFCHSIPPMNEKCPTRKG